VAISSHCGLSRDNQGAGEREVGDLAGDERLRDELVSMQFVETVGRNRISHAPGSASRIRPNDPTVPNPRRPRRSAGSSSCGAE
jgi:hypothetical protein